MPEGKQSWRQEEDEEEEDEEIDETDYIAQKDAVIFAIDVSKSMLAPPPPSDSKNADTDSPTSAALKCAYQIMQQRIISNPKDKMGVLLFGTKQSKFQAGDENRGGDLTYPHCYLLNDLDVPAAEDVKALKDIVSGDKEASSILVPSEEPVVMSNLLFCANQIFTTNAPNFGARRLFIITDNDDPHSTEKNARNTAQVRAKDLYDLGVTIELFPISRPDHEFDRKKFYDDIIYRDSKESDEAQLSPANLKSSGDGISLLNNLIADIHSKQVAKRALFSNLPFEIGPGFNISVKGYNILSKQRPALSCFIWLEGEKAQVAVGMTEKTSETSAAPLEKDQIKKAYKMGGDTVLFTPEEQKELKNFGPPGLRIIGFKPQSQLPFWASMNKSTFIYPSEDDYVGSTRVFTALWQKLLKDEKMGIAWYIARKNASPMLVAVLPSAERLDEATNVQVIPAGLWLHPLPYADDIRHIPEVPKPLVSPDELTDRMNFVVRQLQLPKAIYDPLKYPNPALQWHYRILQAIALEEELPDIPEDKTIPKYRQIEKRAGEYIYNWGVTLDEKFTAHEKERRGKHLLEDADEAPKKKAKAANGLETMSSDDVKKAARAGTLGGFTVPDIKRWLLSKGLSSSGKKADLVERIEQWVEDSK